MKKTGIIFSAVLFCFLNSASVNAQDYKAAVGVRFSSKAALVNNSVSLKYFFSEKTAVEGLISFSDPFALGLLVEQHKPLLTNNFKYFYGAGFYGAFSGLRRAGLQGVVGLDYKVPMLPLNFSIDWKPELTFAKEFSFEPQTLGVSARFTFK
jgi:hypothetical protein